MTTATINTPSVYITHDLYLSKPICQRDEIGHQVLKYTGIPLVVAFVLDVIANLGVLIANAFIGLAKCMGIVSDPPQIIPHSTADVQKRVAQSFRNFPQIDRDKKYAVRDEIKGRVNQMLDEIFYIDDIPHEKIVLYKDSASNNTYSKEDLLGRYDVLQTPCKMDKNTNWNERPETEKTPFFVHHLAAPNIGESQSAAEFSDFQESPGKLDEEKYLAAFSKIFHNALSAQKQSGAQDCVWMPIGMGAFLRNLDKNDSSYSDDTKLQALREKIADVFVRAVQQNSDINIRLCLPKIDDESRANHTAFMQALKYSGKDIDRFYIYENADAAEIAQNLVNRNGEYTVSLANGANRRAIGNHWFEDHALRAIDENLHRRSTWLAFLAAQFNQDDPSKVGIDEANRGNHSILEHRVREMTGKVVTV